MNAIEQIMQHLKAAGIEQLALHPIQDQARYLAQSEDRLTLLEVMGSPQRIQGLTLTATLVSDNEPAARRNGALMDGLLKIVAPVWTTSGLFIKQSFETFAKEHARLLAKNQSMTRSIDLKVATIELMFFPQRNTVVLRVKVRYGSRALAADVA